MAAHQQEPARATPSVRGAVQLRPGAFVLLLAGLLTGVVLLQAARERLLAAPDPDVQLLYVRSGALLQRLALSYDALLADVYWIRAIQHYGGTRLSKKADKRYDILYPLLDIVTTLDPRFMIAYRFGAIFLAEGYPNGPGRPDQAVALLEKGMRAQPDRWQYPYDAGFVHYWWLGDYRRAAGWFERASRVPGAPWWLQPLAATTLAQGGDREASRAMWRQMRDTADNEWLRHTAEMRLAQLAVLDDLDALTALVARYRAARGRTPASWAELVGAGLLRAMPVDPTGTPYTLDGAGRVGLSRTSALWPLPPQLVAGARSRR